MLDLPDDKIAQLCRNHGVTRLELFGSAETDQFGADSDYDFFVTFDPNRIQGIKQYFEFKDNLELLLGRPVDLVDPVGVRNRTFLKSAETCRRIVYAA